MKRGKEEGRGFKDASGSEKEGLPGMMDLGCTQKEEREGGRVDGWENKRVITIQRE